MCGGEGEGGGRGAGGPEHLPLDLGPSDPGTRGGGRKGGRRGPANPIEPKFEIKKEFWDQEWKF